MSSRLLWVVNALFFYAATIVVLLAFPALRETGAVWRLAHGALYGLWGMVLLGALARAFPHAAPHTWRTTTLFIGAAAAALGLWATQRVHPTPSIDAWLAALLGLTIAVMLPRWLPQPATRWWLSIERRTNAEQEGA